MGDRRFEEAYEQIVLSPDRVRALDQASIDKLVHALAWASQHRDPLLANIIATEILNRYRSHAARAWAAVWRHQGSSLHHGSHCESHRDT